MTENFKKKKQRKENAAEQSVFHFQGRSAEER
jgi:hypothetical protein